VIIRRVIGSIDHCNNEIVDIVDYSGIVAETGEGRVSEGGRVVADDIVVKEQQASKQAKCFSSTRVNIVDVAWGKSNSFPEGRFMACDDPCKTALFVFLDGCIAN